VAFDWLRPNGATSPWREFVYDSYGNICMEKTDISEGVGRTVITYEYDRRRNPFMVLKGVMHFFHGYNSNNPLKTICVLNDSFRPARTETRHEYVYDESGYPVYERYYRDGELAGGTKYEYEPVPETE
jgi:hypothetical protein